MRTRKRQDSHLFQDAIPFPDLIGCLEKMNLTNYHAKYYVATRRLSSDCLEKLVDAQSALNPHQVDAALFAFDSPLSKGALLADEVGPGKTKEAGLVLSQKWPEHKRQILLITPVNLRKQQFSRATCRSHRRPGLQPAKRSAATAVPKDAATPGNRVCTVHRTPSDPNNFFAR